MSNSHTPDRLFAAKLAVTRARFKARQLRDEATAALGGRLGRLGRQLILRIHRNENVRLPPPISVGDRRFDIVSDLVEYTRLPREELDALLRREANSFRAEWFLTPPRQRLDDWFYLSSVTYLFGNAIHEPQRLLRVVADRGARPGRALDFGGGTGNLALGLAVSGWTVDYLERSALQKDFVAFRIDRHGLADRVRILHDWEPLERDAYDLVCAIDVLEHVEQLDELLDERLLPGIRDGGWLVESSPFARSLSNPMHHEHRGLEATLRSSGFELEAETDAGRVWRRTA